MERLRQHLLNAFGQEAAVPPSRRSAHEAEEVPRIRVGSPRLAEPERAADFAMEVAEVFPDAGL